MIGLVAKPGELPAVREFFELFKTPWELCEAGRAYEVVLSTGELPAEFDGSLLIIYSATLTDWDVANGIRIESLASRDCVQIRQHKLPIYHQLGGLIADDAAEPRGYLEVTDDGYALVRIGYDLFAEVAHLLSVGQPPAHAPIPALELHIDVLRTLIVDAGLPLVEIPPVPAGYAFTACLTHDIDFLRLRQHKCDRTMWGFLFRALFRSSTQCVRGNIGVDRLLQNWLAAARLPLVHLGLADDFWWPFERYLVAEQGRPSTFFLIPFKNRNGRAPNGKNPAHRAVRYDVDDVRDALANLRAKGCEVALHGIDAWHDEQAGRDELNRVSRVTGEQNPGVRMHWLYYDAESPRKLDAAGFAYDSTCGYNDAVGYRAGTPQVFRPLGAARLLELPFAIQDTALFYPGRMNLPERDAWNRCRELIQNALRWGGALTLIWHDRSLAPERLWGEFYRRLLDELTRAKAWFATARQVVAWFAMRREIRFSAVDQSAGAVTVRLDNVPRSVHPDFCLRVHFREGTQTRFIDVPLQGRIEISVNLPEQEAHIGARTAMSASPVL